MRLRLATRFSALIVAIFVLALLSNLMALFAAWRVQSRLAEIAGADVPSVDAASAFRTVLQEERLLFATYPAVGGEVDWLKAAEEVESRLQDALDAMALRGRSFRGRRARKETTIGRVEGGLWPNQSPADRCRRHGPVRKHRAAG